MSYKTIHQNKVLSGLRNEVNLITLIGNYTDIIKHNVRLNTLLTTCLTTEIDIIFYFKGYLHVVETKNVLSIKGYKNSYLWDFVSKSGNYSNLNTIIQNKIHVRVLKSRFFELYQIFPKIYSYIVIPNAATVNVDIKEEIFTYNEFETFLLSLANKEDLSLKYRFMNLIK